MCVAQVARLCSPQLWFGYREPFQSRGTARVCVRAHGHWHKPSPVFRPVWRGLTVPEQSGPFQVNGLPASISSLFNLCLVAKA